MADFVIFTSFSVLLGHPVHFIKLFSCDSFNQSALITRLMIPLRHPIISCGRFNSWLINDAMAGLAVYHEFLPCGRHYPRF